MKGRAVLYTLISALAEPIGALLAFILFRNLINNFISGILYSIVAGIMINISFNELISEALSYKRIKNVLIYAFLGFISTIIVLNLF